MATLSSDGKYVTVQSGDTLYRIAKNYGNGKTYQQLAEINGIKNANLIYVGQKIYLSKDGSSSGTTTTTAAKKDPNITHFGRLASDTTGKTLFATWTWSKYKDKTASYKVLWTYDPGNGIYFGSVSSVNVDKDAPGMALQSTFTIPDGAKYVKFKVKPIAETETKNNKEVEVWSANWSEEKKFDVEGNIPPEKPTTAPNVDIVDYKLVMSLNNLDSEITTVDFRIYKDYEKILVTKTGVTVVNGRAAYTHSINAGSAYTVQYRVVRNKLASDWSDLTDAYSTKPDAPDEIVEIRVTDVDENDKKGQVYLKWTGVNAAINIPNDKVTYDIQYAQKKEYFDTSDLATEKSGIENVEWTVDGLETGKEYFFRVRATNDKGSSAWTESKSVIVGSTPEPPTTWSSVTTAIVGKDVWLYWVHNSSDNSYQKYAELELYIDDVKCIVPTFADEPIDDEILSYTPLSEDDLEDGRIHSCLLKTSQYAEGTKFKWSVQTAGITGTLSKSSTQRTIDVYATPTLEMHILRRDGEINEDGGYDLVDNDEKIVTSFPFYINAVAGPNTQAPIGYHLAIASTSIYETTDNIGNPKTVNAGEQIYSKYFDTIQDLQVEFTPGNISLENNIEYIVTCTVSMNSGLTATESLPFTVIWEGAAYEPNAAIGVDRDSLTASIRPYCVNHTTIYREVTHTDNGYELTDIVLESAFPESVYVKTDDVLEIDKVVEDDRLDGAITTTNEQVYFSDTDPSAVVFYCVVNSVCYRVDTTEFRAQTTTGERVYLTRNETGDPLYYSVISETTPITDVYLSVYRREFDGSFTEIASGLDGNLNTTVTDPHPSLDFARYRIVATDKSTGYVSYYDLPGYPVGEVAVIIQWDESWTNFETDEEAAMEQPPWSGSLLRLPYNIDVSENVDPEVEMIEYIGRANPVSYYGTQRRQTATWNVVIEKSDKETVYALRRLANWMSDAYVREPSGIGYWAHVVVSFNQTHLEKTIPVTLTITRVEGGM